MEKEVKDKLTKIIRDSINDIAYEQLSKIPEILKKKKEERKRTKAQKEEQVHNDIFFGGDNKKELDTKIKLRESKEVHITQAEIDSFKNELTSHLGGHSIKFINKNINGKESIVAFPLINGALDAVIQIIVDDNIFFKLSLRNGLILKTNEVKIMDNNKDLVQKMYNLYKTVFKNKFTEMINS